MKSSISLDLTTSMIRWQHAKRELVYRNCDHYCNTEVLQNTFPDLYSEFYKVPEVKIEMKKKCV